MRLLILLILPSFVLAQDVSVLTQHNDPARTGANLSEKLLTPRSVRQERFGKIFSLAVDGQIYAQPLVVAGVDIPGRGIRNVVYVATMRNNIYAFDAEGREDAPLWKVNLGTPMLYNQIPFEFGGLLDIYNIRPFIGITSTPVIDPDTKRLYAVAKIAEPGQPILHRIHAIDIRDGKIIRKADINIPRKEGQLDEMARRHLQRPGLLLANGLVYVAFGSHQDAIPYQGWLLAFDKDTLGLTHTFCVTPGGLQGGIWQSGNGPAADHDGNIYVMTSNGSFDPSRTQFSDSFVKLSPDLSKVDWFTPANVTKLNVLDIDLGSAGPMLLPDSLGVQEMVGAGKEGKLYLVSRTEPGHQQRRRHCRDQLNPPIQFIQAARPWRLTWLSWLPFLFYTGYHHIHGSPVFWNSRSVGPLIYVWPEEDNLKAFKYNLKTKLNRSPIVGMPNAKGMPGGILSVSANGQDDGLVWAAMPLDDDAFVKTVRGVLRVFDANTLETLWSSDAYEPDDDFNFAKYVPPTVANGKVYLATFSDRLNVYGLNSPFAALETKPAAKAPKNLHKRKNLHKQRREHRVG
jgi:outer membrane protein assembly factor BamB